MKPDWPPIPLLEEDWSLVPPIVECCEQLVELPAEGRLFAVSMYHAAGIAGAAAAVQVRQGVRERLEAAVEVLPPGVGLRVSDGYRPLAVQQALWDQMASATRTSEPTWSDTEVEAHVRQFVASPVFNPLQPPPHLTGGAIDLCLVDASGKPFDVGTSMDDAHHNSFTAALEAGPLELAGQNRRMLVHAMRHAGFVNYFREWWHYEFGTIRWAKLTSSSHAIYGGLQ